MNCFVKKYLLVSHIVFQRSLTLVASEPWLARKDKAPLLLHNRHKTLLLDNRETDMTETKPREHLPKEELMKHESRDSKPGMDCITKPCSVSG